MAVKKLKTDEILEIAMHVFKTKKSRSTFAREYASLTGMSLNRSNQVWDKDFKPYRTKKQNTSNSPGLTRANVLVDQIVNRKTGSYTNTNIWKRVKEKLNVNLSRHDNHTARKNHFKDWLIKNKISTFRKGGDDYSVEVLNSFFDKYVSEITIDNMSSYGFTISAKPRKSTSKKVKEEISVAPDNTSLPELDVEIPKKPSGAGYAKNNSSRYKDLGTLVTGPNLSSSRRTVLQETLTCYFCAAMANNPSRKRGHYTYETLKKYSRFVTTSVDLADIYWGIDESFFNSCFMQAKALSQRGWLTSRHHYYLDAELPKIKARGMELFNQKYPKRKIAKPDKYNTSDIFMVAPGTNLDRLYSLNDLYEYNAEMSNLLSSHKLVGISLKKIDRAGITSARVKVKNHHKRTQSLIGNRRMPIKAIDQEFFVAANPSPANMFLNKNAYLKFDIEKVAFNGTRHSPEWSLGLVASNKGYSVIASTGRGAQGGTSSDTNLEPAFKALGLKFITVPELENHANNFIQKFDKRDPLKDLEKAADHYIKYKVDGKNITQLMSGMKNTKFRMSDRELKEHLISSLRKNDNDPADIIKTLKKRAKVAIMGYILSNMPYDEQKLFIRTIDEMKASTHIQSNNGLSSSPYVFVY